MLTIVVISVVHYILHNCITFTVSLRRDSDDVPHCRILSSDEVEWQLIPAALCRWRRYFQAD